MDYLSRFFGRKSEEGAPKPGELVATEETGATLQVVFEGDAPFPKGALVQALQRFHPSMRKARGSFDPELNQENVFGLIGWDEHVIRLVGFYAPIPAETLEACVSHAHYDEEEKDRIIAHKSHLLLYYAGRETNRLAQSHALIAAAASFAPLGAVGILNETACASLPANLFVDPEIDDRMSFIQSLPMPMLCCGFLKYQIEGRPGVWMRSFGANALSLPDLAMLRQDHEQSQETFDVFSSILDYLHESGVELAAGETMELGDLFIRLREPMKESEPFLEQDGPIFVLEEIDPLEIDD